MNLESIRSRIFREIDLVLQGHDFAFDSRKMIHRVVVAPGIESRIVVPLDVPDDRTTIRFSMNIGIHCPGFEQLLDESLKSSGNRPLSVCQNIGQLMGRRSWLFWEVNDVWSAERASEELTDSLKRFGLPWMRKFDNVKAMWRWLRKNHGSSDWRQLQLLEQYAWKNSKAMAT